MSSEALTPSLPPENDGASPQDGETDLLTPAVRELVALGAALACNCEPCLRYHYEEAKKLNVSAANIKAAFEIALAVKQTPARRALTLANRLLGNAAEAR